MKAAKTMNVGKTNYLVCHVGNDPAAMGSGISSVISCHLANPPKNIRVTSITSYDPDASGFLGRSSPALLALFQIAFLCLTKPVVIHGHLSQRGSLFREGALVVLARALGRPTVVTLHGSSLFALGRPSWTLLRLIFGFATCVHVLSEAHRVVLPVRTRRKAVVIVNSVETPMQVRAYELRDRSVVFAGEVGIRKGVDLLIRAWINCDMEGWTLSVYGNVDPDFRAEMNRLRGESKNVEWLGLADRSVVAEALGRARVAVLPSRREALPMFILEAMANGCLVVTSDVGGLRDLTANGSGYCFRSDDLGALTLALTTAMTSPDSVSIAERGRSVVMERYGASNISMLWGERYMELARSTRW